MENINLEECKDNPEPIQHVDGSKSMKKFDISDEKERTYHFLTLGVDYTIKNPISLYIKSGSTGHRILDSRGLVHWVPTTQFHTLTWVPKDPNNPVQF